MATVGVGAKNSAAVVKYGGGVIWAYDTTNTKLYNLGEVQESTISVKDTAGKPETVLNEAGETVATIAADSKIEGEFSGLLMQSDSDTINMIMGLNGQTVKMLYQSTKRQGINGSKTQFIYIPKAVNKMNFELKSGTKRIPFSFELYVADTDVANDDPTLFGMTIGGDKAVYPIVTTGNSITSGTLTDGKLYKITAKAAASSKFSKWVVGQVIWVDTTNSDSTAAAIGTLTTGDTCIEVTAATSGQTLVNPITVTSTALDCAKGNFFSVIEVSENTKA